ncbi:probable disease resistance protein At4g33300 [Cryptomeria japonica]|uniref:probable disease resistance protein At4g33300 n=1 Tax=Cryptomeria japonica TaxID=3369 RepID=UPI0025AC1927|nr:probable disease resistance protein At4g33300 [Cryptomeria japonica]
MRDLALYLANHDNNIYRRRLYMPKMKDQLPSDWEVLSSKAHTVSIHTGAMKDTDWPQMEFPKVKALVLYFIASEYCIPTFLHTMKNLKVLIIHNADGAKRSKLSGVAGFQELSQLKTLHLERLIVPEEWKGLGRDKTFNFPGLLEFNVSYCIDLEELPAGLCSSNSLKKLSVTHCHRLAKLPDEMDKLLSLKKITLFESPGLTALPSSICHLKKLKFLDISSCICLKVNKWRRCELKDTLQRVAKMSSLKRVICDKKNEQLFKSTSRTDLKVHTVVEQEGNLDWLYLKTLNGRN